MSEGSESLDACIGHNVPAQERLTTMFSFPVVTWIGNAAAVLSGRWGAVSRRAQEVGCSREAMDQQARRVEQAVVTERAGDPRREALLAENQRLRDDHRILWELLEEAESLSKAMQQKFVATAWAMGVSLGQLVTLVAILLPACRVPSRATVGRIFPPFFGQVSPYKPLTSLVL